MAYIYALPKNINMNRTPRKCLCNCRCDATESIKIDLINPNTPIEMETTTNPNNYNSCPEGYEYYVGGCYEQCKSNEKRTTPTICTENCREGTRFYGGRCYEGDGNIATELTYTLPRSELIKKPCASNECDDGISCWSNKHTDVFGLTHCIGGRITATLSDRAQCPDGHGLDPAKTGCWPVNCRPGFDRIGATCTRKSYQPNNRLVGRK